MKAHEIMRQPVLAAAPDTTARRVAGELAASGISGIPVVDADGAVLGVVSEADILRTLIEANQLGSLTVKDVMDNDPVTVDVETPVEEVMRRLIGEGIVRVPVTKNGKLVGIVSRSDVIRSLIESEVFMI